jgi:hypothetical protein
MRVKGKYGIGAARRQPREKEVDCRQLKVDRFRRNFREGSLSVGLRGDGLEVIIQLNLMARRSPAHFFYSLFSSAPFPWFRAPPRKPTPTISICTAKSSNGDPVESAPVKLHRWQTANGRRQLEVVGQTTTSDEGNFRLAELTPGNYFLSFAFTLSPTPRGVPDLRGTEIGGGLRRRSAKRRRCRRHLPETRGEAGKIGSAGVRSVG